MCSNFHRRTMGDAAEEKKPEVKKDEETITIRVKDQVGCFAKGERLEGLST